MGNIEARKVRIYKLSTFDIFTAEERALNEDYKSAKVKEILKKIKGDKIASYEGIRKKEKKPEELCADTF